MRESEREGEREKHRSIYTHTTRRSVFGQHKLLIF